MKVHALGVQAHGLSQSFFALTEEGLRRVSIACRLSPDWEPFSKPKVFFI